MAGTKEAAGWCGACRVIWSWCGTLLLQNADCPQCSLPLVRRPRSGMGRYRSEERMPVTRPKPALVLTVIDDTKAAS